MAEGISQDHTSVKLENIDSMTKMYEQFFLENKAWVEEGVGGKERAITGLWDRYVKEKGLGEREVDKHSETVRKKELDVGLKWISSASHNFRRGAGEAEELYYATRVSTGVDWLLIGEESWQKGALEKKTFEKQLQIDSLEEKMGRKQMSFDEKLTVAAEIFDYQRLKIWLRYAQMLEKQTVLNDSLYKYNMISYPYKLNVNHRLNKVRETISRLRDYLPDQDGQKNWQQYESLPYEREVLPSVKWIKQQNLLIPQEEVMRLKNELALAQIKYRKGVNFRVQLRYNYYDGFNDRDRARFFPSVGASLSVPLKSIRSLETNAKYEGEQRNLKILQEKEQVKIQLLRTHRNYTDLELKLLDVNNRMIYLEEQMKRELEIWKSLTDDFSPSKYNNYLQEYVEEHIAYLDLKQRMFEEYLVFYTLAELDEKNKIRIGEYEQEGETNTYLWQKDFQNRENEEIISTLKKYDINRLLLSPGNTSGDKVKEFLQLSQMEGIKVQRLLSENRYTDFRLTGNEQLLNKLEEIKESGFEGVHLNFEPHTQKDYRENIENYVQKLNEVYALTEDWCSKYGMSLSVSVPMHLPEENAQFLKTKGIPVYIMAYGEVDQEKLLKRTARLRELLRGQYVWVIRNIDFKDTKTMEAAVSALNAKGIKKIGFYHFGTIERDGEN